MSFTVVQQATAVNVFSPTTSGSISLTGVTGGNALLIMVAGGNSAFTTGVTDSQSQTVLTATSGAASQGNYGIFYVLNANAGSHTANCSVSNTQTWTMMMAEISGIPTTSAFDAASIAASGFGTAIAANNVTPAGTGEFAVSVIGTDSSPSISSWNSPQAAGNSGAAGFWGFGTLASSSAFSAQATYAANADWVIGTALFKAASGGGGPPTYYYLGSQNFY